MAKKDVLLAATMVEKYGVDFDSALSAARKVMIAQKAEDPQVGLVAMVMGLEESDKAVQPRVPEPETGFEPFAVTQEEVGDVDDLDLEL